MTTPADSKLRLSIIVVNWNVRDLLEACLTSIQQNTRLSADEFEVIVVDNASEDRSADMVHDIFPDVRLIRSQENLGFARGCNAGYDISRGDFIFLLNPDTVILDNAIDVVLDEMERRPDAGAIGCRLLNKDRSFQRSAGGAFPSLRNTVWNYFFLNRLLPSRIGPEPMFFQGDPQGVLEVDWVSGAAMLVRREALNGRFFDESFFLYGEDIDICDRIHRNGWKVFYTSEASVLHYKGRSFKKQSTIEVLEMAFKGPRSFFKRNRGPLAVFTYDSILFIGYLFRWPAYRLMSLFWPKRGYDELSSFSRQYVSIILGLLLRRRAEK